MEAYYQDLFKYVKLYEDNYQQFDTEAFLQTYNGIYTLFKTLREQRDKAVEVDYFFLDQVRETPINKSGLRELCIQILITFFESEADIDGRSNQAYGHCRGQRSIKQDVAYFEKDMLGALFKDGSLKGNFRLHQFFLTELARYINSFGKKIDKNIAPETFNAMTDPRKFLELSRRRLELGEDLPKDRESLEFHLQRIGGFTKLASRSKIYKQYLSSWQYLKKADFWSNLKASFGSFFGKLFGAFSNLRYFRLVISQRNPAYLFYTLVIVFFLSASVILPLWWGKHTEKKLEQFRERAVEVQKKAGK